MPKQLFNKVTIQFHALIIGDDGEVMDEIATDLVQCRTLEEISEKFVEAKSNIDSFNASQPNRRQRRAK